MVKKGLYSLLRGGFLTDASSLKNWRFIFFVVGLLLLMIASAHEADGKVMRIAALNKKKRELRAEYVDTGTYLMRMKMESSIRKRLKGMGIGPSKTAPKKIKVIHKK